MESRQGRQRGKEHLYEDRLKEQDLFILEKKLQRGGSIYCLKLPNGRMWSQAPLRGAQGKDKRQWTDCSERNIDQIQGKIITERVTEHWNRLPRDMSSPSLDRLKTEPDMALSNFF